MKYFILSLLLLSGCVSKFDNGEYSKLVDSAVILDVNICNDTKTMKTNLGKFKNQIRWISIYETGLPNNSDTINLLAGLTNETDRFVELSENTVSAEYCKLKIEGMSHTLQLILNTEARKPQ